MTLDARFNEKTNHEKMQWLATILAAMLAQGAFNQDNVFLPFKAQVNLLHSHMFNDLHATRTAKILALYERWKVENLNSKGYSQWVDKITDLMEAGQEDEAYQWMLIAHLYARKNLMGGFSWIIALILPSQNFEQGLPNDKCFRLARFAVLMSQRGPDLEEWDSEGLLFIMWWQFKLAGTAHGKMSIHLRGGLQIMSKLVVDVRSSYGTFVRFYYFLALPSHIQGLIELEDTTTEKGKKEVYAAKKALRAHKVISDHSSALRRSTDPEAIAKVKAAFTILQLFIKARVGHPDRCNDITNFMKTLTSDWDHRLLETSVVQSVFTMVVDSPDRLFDTEAQLGPNARPLAYRQQLVDIPRTILILGIGFVASMAAQLNKWMVGKVGAGVIIPRALAGDRNRSPAANRQSTAYAAFDAQVQSISGLSATVWDFSHEMVPVLTGEGIIHPAVYVQPPQAIKDYVPHHHAAAAAAVEGNRAVGIDALMNQLGTDNDSDSEMD